MKNECAKAVEILKLISEDYEDLLENLDSEDSYLKNLKEMIQELGNLVVNAAHNICPKFDDFDISQLAFPGPSNLNKFFLTHGYLIIYRLTDMKDYYYINLHYFGIFFRYHEL